MPDTEVLFFKEDNGSCPVLDWLDTTQEKVHLKFLERIGRLGQVGHELQRPLAGTLRDGIYELRVNHMRVNYRLLHFFCGCKAVLSHGMKQESSVPDVENDRAIRRIREFEQSPDTHTYAQGRSNEGKKNK